MAEHSLEFVIKLTAPQPWNRNAKSLVKRVVHEKAAEAIDAANYIAGEWSSHGEPVTVTVEFREVEGRG